MEFDLEKARGSCSMQGNSQVSDADLDQLRVTFVRSMLGPEFIGPFARLTPVV